MSWDRVLPERCLFTLPWFSQRVRALCEASRTPSLSEVTGLPAMSGLPPSL